MVVLLHARVQEEQKKQAVVVVVVSFVGLRMSMASLGQWLCCLLEDVGPEQKQGQILVGMSHVHQLTEEREHDEDPVVAGCPCSKRSR